MRNYKDNIIVKLTFQFALDMMSFSEKLRDQKRFSFADQLLGSESKFDKNYPKPEKPLPGIESILKILNKIISTSKAKTKNRLIEKSAN